MFENRFHGGGLRDIDPNTLRIINIFFFFSPIFDQALFSSPIRKVFFCYNTIRRKVVTWTHTHRTLDFFMFGKRLLISTNLSWFRPPTYIL